MAASASGQKGREKRLNCTYWMPGRALMSRTVTRCSNPSTRAGGCWTALSGERDWACPLRVSTHWPTAAKSSWSHRRVAEHISLSPCRFVIRKDPYDPVASGTANPVSYDGGTLDRLLGHSRKSDVAEPAFRSGGDRADGRHDAI